MKLSASKVLLAFAALVIFSAPGFAQRGGAGRPAGVGAGSMGGPAGAGMGSGSARPGDMGAGNMGAGNMGAGNSESMGRPSVSSQSPHTALSNPHLDSSLTNALQKSGVTIPGGNLQTACSAFKNLGQCVAAMHVAKNLNLNFADMQNKMTGSGAESLGKAIKDLGGPGVNVKSEAKKANKQASHDLNALNTAS